MMFLGVFAVQIENLPYSYFQSIWPNDLEHMSYVALRSWIIFTKFKVC